MQPIISGPSKEKGSESSGSDLILYVFVTTSFVKNSLGSKWNSKVKVFEKVQVRISIHNYNLNHKTKFHYVLY